MSIMFITSSGLPVAWILAIHPGHTIPRERVDETAEIQDMVKLKEMAQTQPSLLSPFVFTQEKKRLQRQTGNAQRLLKKITLTYKEH